MICIGIEKCECCRLFKKAYKYSMNSNEPCFCLDCIIAEREGGIVNNDNDIE